MRLEAFHVTRIKNDHLEVHGADRRGHGRRRCGSGLYCHNKQRGIERPSRRLIYPRMPSAVVVTGALNVTIAVDCIAPTIDLSE